jgi:effector-binding domain-containing protein
MIKESTCRRRVVRIKVTRRNARRTIATRFTCSAEEIPACPEKAYGEVFAVMKKQKLFPVGQPFCLYYNDDMKALDIEAGMPVLQRVKEDGTVRQGELPGGITFEIYRNDPGKKRPEKLKTDVYMKLAET